MLISIITVTYNDVAGLERTIKSVQEQSATNYEHILIDGGSTDGSIELIEQHQDRFSYWVSEPDNGIYHAMNKGIAVARGDYLLFLNGGDHFKNESSLSRLENVANESSSIDLIYGNIEVIGELKWIKTYPSELTLDYFVKGTLPHLATLINKNCFNEVNYDTNLDIVADWKHFMIGVVSKLYTYSHVEEVVSVFYYDGISSENPYRIEKERRKVIKEHYPDKLKLHSFYFPSKLQRNIKYFKNQFRSLIRRLIKIVKDG
jgi:glycosyltransferase involved in cell wall biosynthesis